jgi:hypothetical protein
MKVAFYKGRSRLFNKLICWYLRGNYSHCELVFGTNSDGISTCASSSFMDGGVRIKWMEMDPLHWDFVDVPGDDVAAMRWLTEHEGEGYDVLGLLGFIWRRVSGDKRKWFCNEAVLAMLGKPEPWRFDPVTSYFLLGGK